MSQTKSGEANCPLVKAPPVDLSKARAPKNDYLPDSHRTTIRESFFPVGIFSMMQQQLVGSRLATEPMPYDIDPTGRYGICLSDLSLDRQILAF